jgi:cytochrome c oxidase cbb3-type subunit 2
VRHEFLETHLGLLIGAILLVTSIGGSTEILLLLGTELGEASDRAPFSSLARPYTPLELCGRDIYVREGCYGCHSQMIRPFADEAIRYGHYSVADESLFDHPFQWGSRRIGPDLARIGGKYSDAWHARHLGAPRDVIPDSLMPAYPWLGKTTLGYADIGARLKTLKRLGVPYSLTQEEYRANLQRFGALRARRLDILHAEENLIAEAADRAGDGEPDRITELDALIAYLQGLGTSLAVGEGDRDWMGQFR